MRRKLMRLRSLLWHPHQGLWNWDLVTLVRARLQRAERHAQRIERAIITIDSLLLAGRAVARWSRGDIAAARVLYIDCGTHKEGRQVSIVDKWLRDKVAELRIVAFEASPEHVEDARRNLAGVQRLDLRQEALVGSDFDGGTVRLYWYGSERKADSLLRTSGDGYDDVPAVRLSTFLPEDDGDEVVILRMNIEGAEEFVIDDLLAAGKLDQINGFYGMWDDLSKIDRDRDTRFRQRLREHGIRPFSFNDRDWDHPLRLWAIRTHMMSTIARSTGRRRSVPS